MLTRLLVALSLGVLSLTASATQYFDHGAGDRSPVKVCAVPQLYQVMTKLQPMAPTKFTLRFGTSDELFNLIANSNQLPCELVLSSDERLPITLIRAQKGLGSTLIPFARAPLVLWSIDPGLFGEPISRFNSQLLTQLAIASPELTPVGFASHEALKNLLSKTSASLNRKIRNNLYHADQEYEVYSMVQSGAVQAGFITKPLIATLTRQLNGSYFEVPRNMAPDIQYYVLLMEQAKLKPGTHDLIRYLKDDPKARTMLQALGFD